MPTIATVERAVPTSAGHGRNGFLTACLCGCRWDAGYKQAVLPVQVGARIAIEASHADYWYKYVGLEGRIIGMTTFGESAPAPALFEEWRWPLRSATVELSVLVGIQVLALAILAKVGGSALAILS